MRWNRMALVIRLVFGCHCPGPHMCLDWVLSELHSVSKRSLDREIRVSIGVEYSRWAGT